MKWVVCAQICGHSYEAESIHDSLEEAMTEARISFFKDKTGYCVGQESWRLQFDTETDELTFLGLDLPRLENHFNGDAEVEIGDGLPPSRPPVNWNLVERSVEMPRGRVELLNVVRLDRILTRIGGKVTEGANIIPELDRIRELLNRNQQK